MLQFMLKLLLQVSNMIFHVFHYSIQFLFGACQFINLRLFFLNPYPSGASGTHVSHGQTGLEFSLKYLEICCSDCFISYFETVDSPVLPPALSDISGLILSKSNVSSLIKSYISFNSSCNFSASTSANSLTRVAISIVSACTSLDET